MVTGIDLTREYVDVARELTGRCGLDSQIEFFQANALDMPFDNTAFDHDHVWSQNVTMNIEDKRGLVAEVARVLKPGGCISCSEIGLGPDGDPFYPLPWTSDPTASFLVTPDEMRKTLEAGGLRVIEQIDLDEANSAYRREMRERAKRGEPRMKVNPQYFKLGDHYNGWIQNVAKSVEAGRLVEQLIIAEKKLIVE